MILGAKLLPLHHEGDYLSTDIEVKLLGNKTFTIMICGKGSSPSFRQIEELGPEDFSGREHESKDHEELAEIILRKLWSVMQDDPSGYTEEDLEKEFE